MKTIHITHPHSLNKDDLAPTVLALGYFDGVHLGHQKVINTAKKIADDKGIACSVMTFDPHPSVVLGKGDKPVEYITSLTKKEALFKDLQIDYLYIVNFSREFANLLPQQFVDQYIIDLNARHVVAGFDFTYGHLGKGTMETLPVQSRGEFTHTTVEKLSCNNEKVSSTLIKEHIRQGEMSNVKSLLGRNYTVSGMVINGEKRGRTIGFPTANVKVDPDFIVPKLGVYAVRIQVKSKWYFGVCNIGLKPTFHENKKTPSIEVHIFNFNENIYDERVMIEWYERIRSEKKFPSIDELVKQIEQDKKYTQEFFEKIYEHTCFLS
ncbi:bifunctional riboflavin kinase/FAD synthetase [Fredinandcohnia quinoae]|uniref:Riboflavin biosynthesis protein n=1 Tax=Fredinandcohnia quinoae TaxID=2918902 RepID=A0AAW5E4M3_9BACI|nr:bifunctional riboflavin kinase/FAD synthetase [Fredinandcohnia sp. SECRCQ15]